MIRTFNYTNRNDIKRHMVALELFRDGGKLSFSINLDIKEMNYPSDARVFVDAHYLGDRQRFDLGMANNLEIPERIEVTDLTDTSIVDFDVKVSGPRGVLYGFIKNIRIGTEEFKVTSESLMPVNIVPLGEIPYSLAITQSGPILNFNQKITDARDRLTSDPVIRAMVFPFVFKNVVEYIVRTSETEIDEDTWQAKWIKFIKEVLNVGAVPKFGSENGEFDEDQEFWINNCVNEFCRRKKIMNKLIHQETY